MEEPEFRVWKGKTLKGPSFDSKSEFCFKGQVIDSSISNSYLIEIAGPLGGRLELGQNMWGASSLPQTRVIPLVDLVMTHGGNNTVTESFYFGKRLLVLPLFSDQLDNGQRIAETGLGLQFHPYKVTAEELLPAIESLLNNQVLEKRMAAISKRIQASGSPDKAAHFVESVAIKFNK